MYALAVVLWWLIAAGQPEGDHSSLRKGARDEKRARGQEGTLTMEDIIREGRAARPAPETGNG
jgi:hypothetical protein